MALLCMLPFPIIMRLTGLVCEIGPYGFVYTVHNRLTRSLIGVTMLTYELQIFKWCEWSTEGEGSRVVAPQDDTACRSRLARGRDRCVRFS